MKNFIVWTSNSSKLGDVLAFLSYLDHSTEKSILALNEELKLLRLPTFSLIQKKLIEQFPNESSVHTTIQDIMSDEFSTSFDLCYCFETFNVQNSILFNDEKYPNQVFVKVVLGGEQYNNEWIEPEKSFKYYLFSRSIKGVREFNLDHTFNKALIKSKDIEVYLFIKEAKDRLYKFAGIFSAGDVQNDPDNSKYLVLTKN
jgi:hypothetical protein